MSGANQEMLNEFVAEIDEMLEAVTVSLADVEKGNADPETIRSLYRNMHTIKGNAQLFGCKQMGEVAHAIETALEPIRSRGLTITPSLVDVIFQGIDLVRELVSDLRDGGAEQDRSRRVQEIIPVIADAALQIAGGDFQLEKDLIVPNEGLDETRTQLAQKAESTPIKDSAQATPEKKPDQPTPPPTVVSPKKVEPKVKKGAVMGKEARSEKADKSAETLRVKVGLLDNLMNLVGELVLIRNQVIQNVDARADSEYAHLSQSLNVVTTELQDEVMKTRMQPIGGIVTKFHRVVRDLAQTLDKKIDLKLEGMETEIDKTLLEAVKDPLTHIVRNSVDHGIEGPDERESAGKPAQGIVAIKAFHEGGQVIVEVSDDGKGLNRDRIGQLAVERGLIGQSALDSMSDREVHMLIFAPGFSTAQQVSNVSGRGVGMDVVRTNIERIGGMVEIHSIPGEGTTIRLKIPLTLAIVPALVVRSGQERFAIPQVKLVELVRVDRETDSVGIEYLQGKSVYRLRGQLLPLVSLKETLGLQNTEIEQTPQDVEDDTVNIVVLNADGSYFGLVVDEVEDSADIVVKPLTKFMKNLSVYSGATVMGDGSVALTIDVVGLAESIQLFNETDESNLHAEQDENEVQKTKNLYDAAEYLLVDLGVQGRYAIPLCVVSRLEEFDHTQIELSGAQEVVRYRESILPITSVADFLKLGEDGQQSEMNEKLAVIVVSKSDRTFGLRVNQILDVISVQGEIDTNLRDREGILGSLIHEDEVVVVVDAFTIVNSIVSDGRESNDAEEVSRHLPSHGTDARGQHKILVVDDNNFYRKHISGVLKEAGFAVETAVDGLHALNRLEQDNIDYSLVLSDIEMPNMDGFDLASKIREKSEYQALPLVAVTTRFRKQDIERGHRCGFNRYLEKLDPNKLLNEIDTALGLKEAS